MADAEVKFKHSLHRKRNFLAKRLHESGEFGEKVHDARKGEYKRTKLRVTEINYEDEDE